MAEKVRQMFADIAEDYDRTNTVLSLGVHKRWRRKAVALSGAGPGFQVLDCATGTGDLARDFAQAVTPGGRVVGSDFCKEMVELAPSKAQDAGCVVEFQVGDALALPFEDASFDVTSIAFGIRNVDDPVACLQEMARVTKQDGRVVVLEFGQPTGLMAWPYTFYSRHIMPAVGGLLTGNREAYEYLPRTAAAFPAGDAFLEMMDAAGCFARREATSLTGGIAYVYVGEVETSP
ncbi:MAG: bifunctional demethylmenaquinone methyltransferase/2-methoxy-6-polyprenyl-1,4-benzoquinol methylase UbiE [Candidatus Thermoplasmatota archaeon]|nr:bifunctional demethylmenaquinone methyltransferase/2-methoxy-6-polyprenyl-1,4-benzoquinol methylase UbiE [Candidatus Thermoplasmatota archaeon]